MNSQTDPFGKPNPNQKHHLRPAYRRTLVAWLESVSNWPAQPRGFRQRWRRSTEGWACQLMNFPWTVESPGLGPLPSGSAGRVRQPVAG